MGVGAEATQGDRCGVWARDMKSPFSLPRKWLKLSGVASSVWSMRPSSWGQKRKTWPSSSSVSRSLRRS